MFTKLLLASAALAGSLVAVGCGGMQIQYHPMAAPAPAAAASVAVKVVDARPDDQGGKNKKEVGQVRGGFGIPHGVEDAKEDVAPRTVGDATIDALHHAGVDVKDGGGKTLVTTVQSYWMDGFVGYVTHVEVHYDLQDGGGKSLWNADVKAGAGGGMSFSGNAQAMTKDMFERALGELATRATDQFKSAEFLKALQAPGQ
jgi:hypothetical protein